MIDSEDKLPAPQDAAIFLGVTIELIFQFRKQNFAKSSNLRSLKAEEIQGKTWFRESELIAFDELLSGYWCGPNKLRPSIPKAILDHLRPECTKSMCTLWIRGWSRYCTYCSLGYK